MRHACLQTDSGLKFIIEVNSEQNTLELKARDEARDIDLAFKTKDTIDDLYYVNAVWGPYNPIKGEKVFFHKGTLLYKQQDGSVELRSCPIDTETGQPVAALVVHYRFEVAPGADALRISSWFTRGEPCTAETLNWLNLVPVKGDFDTLIGFAPDCCYSLAEVPHSLRFPSLALQGSKGWAVLTECGEAMFTPSPNHADGNQYPGYFKPQATTVNQVNLTLYGKSTPLTATLAVGVGDVSLPNLPVRQYPDPARVYGEAYSLESGELKLTVMNRADGCSVLAMDTNNWKPILGKAGMAPLLRMLVKNLNNGEMHTLSTESGWRSSQVKCFEGGMSIYLREPNGIQDFAVAIEVRATGRNRLEWRTKVLNTNPEYTVLYATYPSVNFENQDQAAGQADSLVLFTPKDSGSLIDQPCNRGYHYNGFYPHGVETPMGYMGLYNTKKTHDKSLNGLYVGLHDTGGARKEMTADFSTQGSACFEFVCIALNINKPANAFELPGVMVWELFCGDWYDMAYIYRDFIHSQANWLPAHSRKDSPDWIRDVPFFIRDRIPSSDNPDSLSYPYRISFSAENGPDDWYQKPIRLAKELGLPMGYHLYDWHWCTYDNDYPNYFPVKEGLKEGVQAMQEHGIYVMPYINGRLWDTHDRRGEDYRFTRDALEHASKKDRGQPYTEFYNSFEPDGRRVELAVMCPSTWRWRAEMLKVTRRLCTEYHMNGVYLDQISCAIQSPCEDPSHNHTPGNGSWWRESYKLLMERIREEVPEGCGFTSESNAEVFTDQFDGFLTWTWLNSNLVPAFPAIYGGYISLFGRNSDRTGETANIFTRYHLAQSLMFGQQLGWINPGIVDDEDLLPYLKKIATYRYEYRSYFNEGDMLRPPKILGEMPVFVTHSAMGESMMFQGHMLMASAWRRRTDGSTLIMAANISDEEHTTNIVLPWEEYGLSPDSLTKLDGEAELKELSSEGLKVNLPPRACLILKSC